MSESDSQSTQNQLAYAQTNLEGFDLESEYVTWAGWVLQVMLRFAWKKGPDAL